MLANPAGRSGEFVDLARLGKLATTSPAPPLRPLRLLSQVMQTGLPPIGGRSLNVGMLAETSKDLLQLLQRYGLAAARRKEGRARSARLREHRTLRAVFLKRAAQLRANGDQA